MATRVKNIWDKAVTLENIEAAIHTAAKGKRAMRQKVAARSRFRNLAILEKEVA